MKTKLFLLDFDGTLLRDDKSVGEKTKQVLKKAQKEGHYLAFVSGRPFHGMQILFERLELAPTHCFFVGCHGAIIYDVEQNYVISVSKMSNEVVRNLFALGQELELYVQCFDEHFLYCLEENETTKKYNQTTRESVLPIGDQGIADGVNILKVMAISYDDVMKLQGFQKYLSKSNLPVEHFYSSKYFYEVTNAKVNKGNALSFLARYLQIDIEDTIAIGDEENDISMIQRAGVGVAMKNARECVLKMADRISDFDHNHDGAAYVMDQFL